MWTIYSMGQVLGQIILLILLILYNILHIGTKILNLICVAMGLGFRISWFWRKYKRQTYFKANLCAYWVLIFLFKVLYGRTPD